MFSGHYLRLRRNNFIRVGDGRCNEAAGAGSDKGKRERKGKKKGRTNKLE